MQKKSQKTVVEKMSFGVFFKPNCYTKIAVIKNSEILTQNQTNNSMELKRGPKKKPMNMSIYKILKVQL